MKVSSAIIISWFFLLVSCNNDKREISEYRKALAIANEIIQGRLNDEHDYILSNIETYRVKYETHYKALVYVDSVCKAFAASHPIDNAAIYSMLSSVYINDESKLLENLSVTDRNAIPKFLTSDDSLLTANKLITLNLFLVEKIRKHVGVSCYKFDPPEASYYECCGKGLVMLSSYLCKDYDSIQIDLANPKFITKPVPASYKPIRSWTSKGNIFIETEPLASNDGYFWVKYNAKVFTPNGLVKTIDNAIEFELNRSSNRLRY